MRLRQIMLAGSAAVMLVGTAPAWADQTFSGLVTIVDRTTGEVVVKRDDGGTVGSGTAAATEKFKLRDGIAVFIDRPWRYAQSRSGEAVR